ncbi:SGNH/GDSL hydrolase family protein [Streptomyces sp. NPDC050738]|uniref:SGNH/GDSL hydrolase family protein n=1 Tax=Streptomyces sp. NPDC050738 TaxID=3154744 RepID=UPI00343EC914
MMKRLRAVLTATALCGGALGAPAMTPSAAAADGRPLTYVALGDSYAAAPLVRPTDVSNLRCMRSLADYPHVAARALGAALTDVSCSGATADHLSSSQFTGTVPQYNALSKDTDVVSITIGGNDTTMFQLALSCVNVLPEPLGASCARTNTDGGTDKVAAAIDAWAPTFGTVLDAIHAKAPHAEVYVVGYGNYLRSGGCYPAQPFWGEDADYVQGKVDHLGGVLEQAAARHGATFVDTKALGVGHDACAAPADRYMEGAVSTRDAFPLHPNADGSQVIGRALAASVQEHSGADLR